MRAWLWLSLLLGTLACDLNPQPTLPDHELADSDVPSSPSPMMPTAEGSGRSNDPSPGSGPEIAGAGGTASSAPAPLLGDSGSGGTADSPDGPLERSLPGDAGDRGAAGF